MIKYNLNNINDWNFGEDNIIKVYRNNAVCYYKVTSGDTPTPVQEPCFAVVDDISQYSDTEFEDVYNLADEKWYKLNNLNQYEQYGVYGSGRTSCEGSTSRLPQGYTEVEYVENTSSAYINTNLVLLENIGDSFEIKVKTYFTPYGSDFEYLFGTEQTSAPYTGIQLRYYQRNLQYSSDSNVVWTHIDNGDGTSGVTASCSSINATNGGNPLTLFCGLWSTGPWRFGRGKIYSFKVTKNDTLVRDLVPCKRDSDEKYGMYDLVTNTFYLSPNNVDFSGGEPITPTDCVTTYEGKLTIDDGYEYIYSGGSWVNLGEVSGSTKTSGFTIDDISNDVTVKSSISDGDYYVISFYKHNNPKEPQYMMSYRTSDNYLNNFSGHTGSNSITPSTVIDAAIWKFEATSTANTYYIKNIYNNLYWGYQTRASNRSLNLVADSSSSKAIVKVGVANSSTTVGFLEMNVNGSSYTYEDGTVGGYALNQLNGYTYTLNWWNTEGWGSDGNSAYYLYKINANNAEYPKYYDEIQDPPDNLVFSSMAEAESYECPWVGMNATIDGDKYVFSGDSQSGYEWVYNPSRLPIGYTEVEYVENTGTSYFNTNFVPNQDTRVVCDMQLVTASNFPRLWGAGTWNSATGIQPNYEEGYLRMSWFGNTSWTSYTSVPLSFDRKVYDVNKNYLYVDSVQIGSNTYTTRTASDPIGVFTYIASGRPSSSMYWGQEHFKGKMYSFQIYDNGTLVRDLVPCVRDNDNEVGAYDIVNDVFYTVPTGYTTDKLVAGSPV